MNKIQPLQETPIVKIGNIYFKREDLNPTGSVKDRAVICQLEKAKKLKFKRVAISSSGNAGISTAHWANVLGLKATIFISPHTNLRKIEKLKSLDSKIEVTPKPIRDCFRYCKKENSYNMRQSLDLAAIEGFSLLGKEIRKQIASGEIKKPQAIFFPVSSGTTLLGVSRGLADLDISLFIVQPANHCPLANIFDQKYQPEDKTIADALVAKIIPRKKDILNMVKKSSGGGVVVSNKKILSADKFLKNNGIQTSYEGALALAGIWKARKEGIIGKNKNTMCLLTGKWYQRQ